MASKPSSANTALANPGYSRREQVGWYFYDWANSAFSTTVVSVFMGPYLTEITKAAADAEGFVYPLGRWLPIAADAFFPYVVSLSVVLQVFFLPIMGAIADYTRLKKQFLAIFAYIGAFATMMLYLLQGEMYWFGGLLFLIANLAFGASIVFYNAFLPEISSPEDRDKVSSQGWALGYLGGGLLLLFNLLFLQLVAPRFGISTAHAVRISIFSAGAWWAIFTLIPLQRLHTRMSAKSLPAGTNFLSVGFSQLAHTFRKLPALPHTLLFLIAYLLYNDGIQTVIALSSQFGSQELGMDSTQLVMLLLMVQFVAFFGALGFGWLAGKIGAKRAILYSLVIWTGVTIYAYAWLANITQYFVLAAVIGLVLGGSQAISRSLFSQMIPPGQEAEYFSLYEISERGTSWLGTLTFGLALQMTGSYRVAILSVAAFFIAGLVILPFVNVRRAIVEAGNTPPAVV